MKRTTIIFLLAILATLTAMAAPPKLACESLFSEKYRTDPNASVSIINSSGNYFRCLRVSDDASLVKEIEKKVNEDRKLAENTVEEYSKGNRYNLILNIPHGKYTLTIGYTKKSDSEAEVFVSGPSTAFK